jgi:hypothetical protein
LVFLAGEPASVLIISRRIVVLPAQRQGQQHMTGQGVAEDGNMRSRGRLVIAYLLPETTSCRGTLAFGSRRKVALQITAAGLPKHRSMIIRWNPPQHYQLKRIRKSPQVVSAIAFLRIVRPARPGACFRRFQVLAKAIGHVADERR